MDGGESQASTQSIFRGRSKRRTASRQPSRSRSRSMPRKGFSLSTRPSYRLNVANGVHRFTRNVNTNIASIVNGTNGIINITSAILGGFRIDGVVASGTTMNWVFTLGAASQSVFSSAGTIQTSTSYAVPSVAEFISLFDNFRIDKIDVTMSFNKTDDPLGPDNNGVRGFPEILMCIDQDDNDYISIEQMLQRENMMIWPLSQTVKTFSFVPKMNFLVSNVNGSAALGVGTFTGRTQPFLDAAASQNAPYYGIKMVMNNANGSTIGNDTVLGQLAINFRYHLSFKTVK